MPNKESRVISPLPETYAVVLAGGRGERFWPLSTAAHPKQTVDLIGGKSLIRQAVERLSGFIPAERIFVVTGEALVGPLRVALPELKPEQVVGEPIPRDTAAACVLGTAIVRARDPRAVVCVLTADHVMYDIPIFQQTLRESAALAAREPRIVTIGIAPTFPSTGYGYIEAGKRMDTDGTIEFAAARRFVEKPALERASEYVLAGNYFWNAGMFVWSVPTFERALEQHRPQLQGLYRAAAAAGSGPALDAVMAAQYPGLEKISIDYAVMERADNIAVATGRFRWYDVGSWPALADHFPADADGNVCVGRCASLDAAANIVVSRERLTALIGVRDLIVVQAGNATLVCRRDRAQDVRALVRKLEEDGGNKDVL
jgi:mannose-1-phosphate guanylyltransferase